MIMEEIRELVLKLIHSLKNSLIEQCSLREAVHEVTARSPTTSSYGGDNFVSLVVFGSLARGDFGLNSDIDLLLIFRQFLGFDTPQRATQPKGSYAEGFERVAPRFEKPDELTSRRRPRRIAYTGDHTGSPLQCPQACTWLQSRMRFFQEIERDIEAEKMEIFESTGYYPHFSPILRTIDEARRFSRIYLDMTEHVLVIYDKDQFFTQTLKDVRNFLGKIGAQKRWIGKKWYWVFSPDVEIGEVLPDG